MGRFYTPLRGTNRAKVTIGGLRDGATLQRASQRGQTPHIVLSCET